MKTNQRKAKKAKRKYFKVTKEGVESRIIEFEFYSGFSISQKIKNIKSMHHAIKSENSQVNILEVSTKSDKKFGKNLSAFNLKLDNKPLEQVFQESKIFKAENKGFIDITELIQKIKIKELTKEIIKNIIKINNDIIIYENDKINFKIGDEICFNFGNFHPRICKTIVAVFLEKYKERIKLNHFKYKNEIFELNSCKKSQTLFYDYIYFRAVQETLSQNEIKQILHFDIFTDIEFNHKKSLNCQARSCALYHYVLRHDKIKHYLQCKNNFEKIYEKYYTEVEDESLF